MSAAIAARLSSLLGAAAVEQDAHGLPRALPDSLEALALVCATAHDQGWQVRVEGAGTWLPPDAPADLAVSTRALDRITRIEPADLVATVEAGVPLERLRRHLADDRMWLALDAPGRDARTIGSVVATGTAGALRHGFGPVRDHVLGCTVVTADGRILRAGGTVVKNVAGYDLTKLQVGGFGAFGILAGVHLRLRALPQADRTLLRRGDRDALTRAAREGGPVLDGAGACELLAPAVAGEADWILAVRLTGTEDGVAADADALAGGGAWTPLAAERAQSLWRLAAHAALGGPVSLRLGVLTAGLDEMLDLVAAHLDDHLVSAGPLSGQLRWSGDATPGAIEALRRRAAEREVPLTVERAPWALRRATGHMGAYREGVGGLVSGLRRTFDPGGLLRVALEGER